jgi:hypothetical protein
MLNYFPVLKILDSRAPEGDTGSLTSAGADDDDASVSSWLQAFRV